MTLIFDKSRISHIFLKNGGDKEDIFTDDPDNHTRVGIKLDLMEKEEIVIFSLCLENSYICLTNIRTLFIDKIPIIIPHSDIRNASAHIKPSTKSKEGIKELFLEYSGGSSHLTFKNVSSIYGFWNVFKYFAILNKSGER